MARASTLTDTQSLILSAASQRDDGCLVLPASVKGAAGSLVLQSLERRGLIEVAVLGPQTLHLGVGQGPLTQPYRITAAGLTAIGLEPDDAPQGQTGSAIPSALHATEPAGQGDDEEQPSGRVGPNDQRVSRARPVTADAPRLTKRSRLVQCLQSDEGATVASLLVETGWLPHTLRAALSGLRKKGHQVVSFRSASGEPAYRIVAAAGEVVA